MVAQHTARAHRTSDHAYRPGYVADRIVHSGPCARSLSRTLVVLQCHSAGRRGQSVSPAVCASLAKTQKPPLHGRHWMAITGKPLGATAGAMIFERGGNAVDAACAMIAATSTMWDVLSWGGETQALIYDPRTKKVIAINGLGMAPTGATPEFYRSQGLQVSAGLRPTRGRHARHAGRPDADAARSTARSRSPRCCSPRSNSRTATRSTAETADMIERWKAKLKEWPYSKQVMLPHLGAAREAPRAGEIFRQPDLAATLRKLVEAEKQALAAGKSAPKRSAPPTTGFTAATSRRNSCAACRNRAD